MLFLEYQSDVNIDCVGTECGGDGQITGPVMLYLEAACVLHRAHEWQSALCFDSDSGTW